MQYNGSYNERKALRDKQMLTRIFVCSLLAAAFIVAANGIATAEDFCGSPLKGNHADYSGVEQIPTGSGSGPQDGTTDEQQQCPHLQHMTGGCPIGHAAASHGTRYLSKCPPDSPASQIALSMHHDSLIPQIADVVPQETAHGCTPYLLQKEAEPQRVKLPPPII